MTLPRSHVTFVLALLAAGFIAVANSAFYDEYKTADKEFLVKSKKIYNLIYHVPQPDIVNPELFKLGQAWNIEEKIDFYTNKVRQYFDIYNKIVH